MQASNIAQPSLYWLNALNPNKVQTIIFTFSKHAFNESNFATFHSLMHDIYLIDSYQAHLHVQDAKNIEFIHQK